MNTSLNNILNLYLPIEGFQTINLTLTDYHGNTAHGSLEGGWYRPIILQPSALSNDGVDLKFFLLVLRGININNILNNGNYFYSAQFDLPIPFVNTNNYRVFWNSGGSGDLLNTVQASYYVINNVPINYWSLGVKAATNNNISNDSVCFIIMYI
jgi:hypothetical protein